MSKAKTPAEPQVEDIESVLRVPFVPFIEFYDEDDLQDITDKWISLEWYNLDNEGVDPDEELSHITATILASQNDSGAVREFYVQVITKESQYLYALESLAKAIDLVRDLRRRYALALNELLQPIIEK